MRKLTKKQKTLLERWYKDEDGLYNWDCLSLEQIKILKNINDTEILYQNVNLFLSDLD